MRMLEHKALALAAVIPVVLAAGSLLISKARAQRNPQITLQEALARWEDVASVLAHPRCLNCHTRTDYPRQGDDRHIHQFQVRRGPDGKGVSAVACSSCHGATNQTFSGVPGAKGWHLAPLTMAWESEPGSVMGSGELCRTLKDKRKNGGRDLKALVDHIQTEPLVLWAWAPGSLRDGTARTLPPLSHDQLLAALRVWTDGGGPCPH